MAAYDMSESDMELDCLLEEEMMVCVTAAAVLIDDADSHKRKPRKK